MAAKLQNLFNQMEAEKKAILQYAENLSIAELNEKPAPGKWSILQIIFHLVKSDKLVAIALEKNIRERNDGNSGINSDAKATLMIIALKTKFKFKAPAIVASVPEAYNFQDLITQWDTVRKTIKEIADTYPEDQLKKIIFDHPYAKDLNIVQTYQIFLEHLRHHRSQIKAHAAVFKREQQPV